MEAATAAPAAQAGAAKPPMPDIPAATRSNADLQAELERRNATELSRFSGQLTTAQSSAIKGVEELQKRNAENLKAFVSELEASKAAAVKSVEELQKRVAAEHATMLQLQTELRAAKAMLDNSQVGGPGQRRGGEGPRTGSAHLYGFNAGLHVMSHGAVRGRTHVRALLSVKEGLHDAHGTPGSAHASCARAHTPPSQLSPSS